MTKKQTISTFLTVYLSIFAILTSTIPTIAWSQSTEIETIKLSSKSEKLITQLQNFASNLYHSTDKKHPALFEKIQNNFKQADIDDEENITFSQQEYNKFLQQIRQLQQKVNNLLEAEDDLALAEKSALIFSTFAYLDLSLTDLLSIWGREDKLAQRYQLLKTYRTKFSVELLSEELQEKIKQMQFSIHEQGDQFYLTLSPFEQIKREIQISVQIPSVANYLKGVRLMALQMMMQQQSLYQSFLGNSNKVKIPRSCQDLAFTRLPSHYTFNMPSKTEREAFIQNMLATNGLNTNSEEYQNYYLYTSNPDLASGSVAPLLPFEKYTLAQQGIKHPNHVNIDDHTFFNQIVNIKQNEIFKLLNYQRHLHERGACGGRRCMHKISMQRIKMIETFLGEALQFSTQPWVIMKNGQEVTIDTAGLNSYLIKQLKAHHKFAWHQIIPQQIIHQWKKKLIAIDYPRLGSPIEWRIWSLKKIYKSVSSMTKRSSYALAKACRITNSSLCIYHQRRRLQLSKTKKNILALLQPIAQTSNYTPTILKNKKVIEKNQTFFMLLWNTLAQRKLLNNHLQEFQLLQNQVNSENPWAALFISFTHFLNSHQLTKREIKLMQKISKTLGITATFSVHIADNLLSKDEKIALWQSVLDYANEQNSYLFNQKTVLRKHNITYYSLLAEISNLNLFDSTKIQSTINSLDRQANIVPMYSTIKEIRQSKDFETIHYLQELYSNMGNPEKEEQIVEILLDLQTNSSSDDEWDNFYSFEPNDIKKLYLEMDNKIKTPLYTYIVQDAASLKLREIKEQVQNLCQLDEKNVDELKEIYYATSKAQMQINQLFGIEANSKVREFLDKYNTHDKRSLWFGLGSAALFIGSTILGAGCTLISGGLCMPLTAAVLASLATGTQLYVANEEFANSIEANARAERLTHFNSLGLTSQTNVDEVKRSYAWGFVEVLFTIPMIGQLGRGVEVGGRIVKAQMRGAFKNLSKLQKKLLYKEAFEQTNAKYAKSILGLSSIKSEFKQVLSTFHYQGKPIVSTSIKALSLENVDQSFADSLMKFFANKPQKFNQFLHYFSDRELQLAKDQLLKLDIYNHPEQLSWFKQIWGKGLPRMKIERLKKFLTQEKSLQHLTSKLDKLEQSPEAYRQFIAQHADSVSTVISSLPFQKREIPHMILALGGPAIRSRIPLYSKLTEVTIAKRIVSARQLLANQVYREIAAKELGLESKKHFHQAFSLYQAFEQSISNLKLSAKEQKALKKMQFAITKNIVRELQPKGIQLDIHEAHQLLFAPHNAQEVAKARLLWDNVASDKLFNFSHTTTFLKAFQQRMRTKATHLNEFQDYVHLLKFMAVTKTPELANIL